VSLVRFAVWTRIGSVFNKTLRVSATLDGLTWQRLDRCESSPVAEEDRSGRLGPFSRGSAMPLSNVCPKVSGTIVI